MPQTREMRRRRELDLPKIVVAQKFKRKVDMIIANPKFPVDHARTRALASTGIHDEQLASKFQSIVTNDAAAMLAQHSRFRGVVLEVTAWWLPT